MKTMTLDEFHAALKGQGVALREDLSFICPMCNTVQSAADLIAAGAGATFDDVERYLGFSCVGRFTGKGSPGKDAEGEGCNWTLGGFFHTHKLEVLAPDGKVHPHFEPATPEQAQRHAATRGAAQ